MKQLKLVFDGTWHEEGVNGRSRLRCVEAKRNNKTRKEELKVTYTVMSADAAEQVQ